LADCRKPRKLGNKRLPLDLLESDRSEERSLETTHGMRRRQQVVAHLRRIDRRSFPARQPQRFLMADPDAAQSKSLSVPLSVCAPELGAPRDPLRPNLSSTAKTTSPDPHTYAG